MLTNALYGNIDVIQLLARVIAFCTAIPVHEAAHAYVSDKLGDPTARRLGRLSLNPLRHLDPLGFFAMLTIGVGWAKPVPINPQYYRNPKVGMAISSAAGPISNLLLALLIMVVYRLVRLPLLVYVAANWATYLLQIIFYLIIINLSLALFNLLPVPPFDGSRIFALFLPEKAYFAIQKYERYIMIGVLLLVWGVPWVFGIDPLGWLLGKGVNGLFNFMSWLTGPIDKLMIALLY